MVILLVAEKGPLGNSQKRVLCTLIRVPLCTFCPFRIRKIIEIRHLIAGVFAHFVFDFFIQIFGIIALGKIIAL